MQAIGEFRCPTKMFGVLTDNELLEVKCNSDRCGAGKGTVVLHYFDIHTLELKETVTFKEPASVFTKKER